MAVLALASIASVADAQNFVIDWSTVDGGGGTSTGGVFSVSGTIGQPDAGAMSGGNFALSGGFWAVVAAIQTANAPTLTATRNATTGVVTISWPLPATGFVLDQVGALNGAPIPWSQLNPPYQTNATHIFVTVPSPSANQFYRVRLQP